MEMRIAGFWTLMICVAMFLLVPNTAGQQKKKGSRSPRPAQTNAARNEASGPMVLTRERAAKLITSAQTFQSTYNSDIPVGTFWYDNRYIKGLVKANIQPLVDNGIITFIPTGKTDGWFNNEYTVEITKAGEEVAKTWLADTTGRWVLVHQGPTGLFSPDVTLYLIPIAGRQLTQVTGIAFDAGKTTAQVEFTWKWVPTSHAKLLPDKMPADQLFGSSGSCRLYDDGWRLESLFIF